MKKLATCQVCGHKGKDVEWQVNRNKSGYFCVDQGQCFKRYRVLKPVKP